LSKIVVFVRTHTNSELQSGISVEEFPNANASNNDRGELIIHKIPHHPHLRDTNNHPSLDSPYGSTSIAVFKEWIYWKEVE